MSMIVSISQKTALIPPVPCHGARDRSRCPLRPQARVVRPPPLGALPGWAGERFLQPRIGLTGRRALFTPGTTPIMAKTKKMAAYQYIYVMKDLGKTYAGGREVLRNIWLSFLPGAKIGVLGLNGAGKSTLLR